MQMKEQNWQYFISMYGFHESGRIVNALYGPLIAYFQGGLLLLTGTWFRYQLSSNLLLAFLAFFSMNQLLKHYQIDQRFRYPISFFFVTTYAIQYWVLRQGFSSWGIALLPICLIPMKELIDKRRLPIVTVGLSVAAMVQTHLFTSLMLVSIYFLVFIYVWIMSNQKIMLFKQLASSMIVCSIFSMNIWLVLYQLYTDNQLVAPFVNKEMYLSTINYQSAYWLLTPISFLGVIFWLIKETSVYRKKLPKPTLFIGGISLVYLLLSTNLIPWKLLSEQSFKIIELIQFPFRFFMPFIVLCGLYWGLIQQKTQKRNKKVEKGVIIISIIQTILVSSFHLFMQYQQSPATYLGKHARFTGAAVEEVVDSFHSHNLSELLQLVNKSTPDYVPIYQKTVENKYELYRQEIIEAKGFDKKVKDGNLIIEWFDLEEEIMVPIVVYKGTELNFNQTTLEIADVTFSPIGAPILLSQKGLNHLEVIYPATKNYNYLFVVVVVLCMGVGGYLGVEKLRKMYVGRSD
jgi:hypothetical protein